MSAIRPKLNGRQRNGRPSPAYRLTALLASAALLTGCALLGDGAGAPRAIAEIQGPEAIATTGGGRVFVTGRGGAYELVDTDGTATLQPLEITAQIPPGCQFTGAETTGAWLFVLCTVGDGSYLMRGRIERRVPVLDRAAALPDVGIASGLTADPRGRLYIADSRQGATAITRVTGALDEAFRPQSRPWLDSTRGGFPNGLQFARGTLYLTSAGRLSAIALDSAGGPGEITPITTRLTFLDDFEVLPGGHFLLTDYSFNRLLLLSPRGIELGAFGHGIKGPTDVALLSVGVDGGAAVLVTERDGERLSRVDMPSTLWQRVAGTAQTPQSAK